MLPTVITITHIVQPLTREKDIRFCIQMGILNNNWIYVQVRCLVQKKFDIFSKINLQF